MARKQTQPRQRTLIPIGECAHDIGGSVSLIAKWEKLGLIRILRIGSPGSRVKRRVIESTEWERFRAELIASGSSERGAA